MNHRSEPVQAGDRNIPSARTSLLQYIVSNGVPNLEDSQLAALFELAKKEGVLQTVMYSDDANQWTSQHLIAFFKNGTRVIWLVYFDKKLAGWVWLDDFGHRTARIHFCFFKWLSKERLTIQVGRELLWILLNTRFKYGVRLEVIRGETPSFNKLALRFIEKVGLKIAGEVPSAAYRHKDGVSYSMIYSYVNRDILREKRESSIVPPLSSH